jgi:endoglucanase
MSTFIKYLTAFLIMLFTLVLYIPGKTGEMHRVFIANNQAGYEPLQRKEAFLVNHNSDRFELVEYGRTNPVFSAMVTDWRRADFSSGDSLAVLDFTDFTHPGRYQIRVRLEPDSNRYVYSDPFVIQEEIYREVTNTVLQSFYYHRCGTEVRNQSQWGYHICHLDDAPYYNNPGRRRDVTGGWHDAGDYNKFTVNTAVSAALLLYLYELDPNAFGDGELDIPEQGNSVPDILDETRWALEWLLKMQSGSGGVYHKVSQKQWIGEYLPSQDPSTRYLFEVSSSATAQFAAVTALASRQYAEYDEAFSEHLLTASLRAWAFLKANPMLIPLGGFKNPPDVFGGEYGDDFDWDERLWAASELYKSTSDEEFLRYYSIHYTRLTGFDMQPISWKNTHAFALNSFLGQLLPAEYWPHQRRVRRFLIGQADRLVEHASRNNYRHLNRHYEFYWGSASVGLAYAYQLIHAFKQTGDHRYRDAAQEQLHYVLGRNPMGISYATGIGYRSVQNPYHQLSEKGDFTAPVPGMLVGGPNNHIYLNDRELSVYPSKNYEDTFKNFFVNEPAINFTAVLAFTAGYFSLDQPSRSPVAIVNP